TGPAAGEASRKEGAGATIARDLPLPIVVRSLELNRASIGVDLSAVDDLTLRTRALVEAERECALQRGDGPPVLAQLHFGWSDRAAGMGTIQDDERDA